MIYKYNYFIAQEKNVGFAHIVSLYLANIAVDLWQPHRGLRTGSTGTASSNFLKF
jgi:hypothetical protein